MKNFVVLVLSVFLAMSANAQSQGQKWLAEARKGNVKAMYQTALRYITGVDGLPKSTEKARYWAEKGGEAGHVGCMDVAASTYRDVETKRFESRRIYWAEKAGEAGSVDGMMKARDSYLDLEWKSKSDADILRCLERQMYWNDKMLVTPNLDDNGQCQHIKEMLEKKLAKYKAGETKEN